MTNGPSPKQSAEELVSSFLRTVEHAIIPLTAIGVASGNKVFGAAILRKDDLSVVIAATNQETSSPLLVCRHLDQVGRSLS
jgi:tRNA(Arg) A34 adenosine deaminase TadA